MQKALPTRIHVDSGVELAKYRSFATYVPKISDFVIWHGWWKRWYGIVTDIDNGVLSILTENLPKLLFTIPEDERQKRTIKISLTKIRSSRGGEYHIIQDGIWYVDD